MIPTPPESNVQGLMGTIQLDGLTMEFCVPAGSIFDFEAHFSFEAAAVDDMTDIIMVLQYGNVQPGAARARTRGIGEHQSVTLKYQQKIEEDTNFRLLLINLDENGGEVITRAYEGMVAYKLWNDGEFVFTGELPPKCATPEVV